MNQYRNISVPLYYFDVLVKYNHIINQFVTSRNKQLPASSKNQFTLGLNGIVENETVLKNRKLIADQLGFSNDSYVFASQVHGNEVAIVKEVDRGRGAFDRSSYLPDVDAMITNIPGICLVTQAADCVPILFFDPVNNAIGVAHAGWKGTIVKIAAETVYAMQKEFGSKPNEIKVGIGPSIGPCCYEVGDEVVELVHKSFISVEDIIIENKSYSRSVFNLWEANKRALIETGINPANIEIAEMCTKCDNNIFFSARAGDKGRFGAGILIKDKV